MVINRSNLSAEEFKPLAEELKGQTSLRDVLAWVALKPRDQVHPQIVAEVVTQDEFTHDVIIPYGNVFLVYDTT